MASLLYENIQLSRAAAIQADMNAIPKSPLVPGSRTHTIINVWVNGIFFTSLALSLSTALLTVLAKQWIQVCMLIFNNHKCLTWLNSPYRNCPWWCQNSCSDSSFSLSRTQEVETRRHHWESSNHPAFLSCPLSLRTRSLCLSIVIPDMWSYLSYHDIDFSLLFRNLYVPSLRHLLSL